MRVLNETYAPPRIQFTVASISHSVNDSWTAQARIRDKVLALRRGGYDDLNLYFDTGLMTNADSATGLCSFPVADLVNTHGHQRDVVARVGRVLCVPRHDARWARGPLGRGR